MFQPCLQDFKQGRLFFVGTDVDDVGGGVVVVMVMIMSVSCMSLAVAVDFRGKSGALLRLYFGVAHVASMEAAEEVEAVR